jgi:hypothetical protein
MWQEIILKDAQDVIKGTKNDKIESFCNIQRTMSQDYQERMLPDKFSDMVIKKQSRNFKVYNYNDKKYELNIVTKITSNGRFQLVTTALGIYENFDEALRIAHKKLIASMKEQKQVDVFALYPSDAFYKGLKYFHAFSDTTRCLVNGFKKSERIKENEKLFRWEASI